MPTVFSRIIYADDEKKIQATLDEEGSFQTGGLAEFRDGGYIFAGRENDDCTVPFIKVELNRKLKFVQTRLVVLKILNSTG